MTSSIVCPLIDYKEEPIKMREYLDLLYRDKLNSWNRVSSICHPHDSQLLLRCKSYFNSLLSVTSVFFQKKLKLHEPLRRVQFQLF